MGRCRAASIACLVAAGCTPALDWREVRPEGSGVFVLLPCRADVQQRNLSLAGRPVRLTLAACSAGGATWALAYADLGDPSAVAPALEELRRSAAANIDGEAGSVAPLAVPGATPHAGSMRFSLAGRLPDGTAVSEHAAVFTRGTRVFQATVVGERPPADGVETFIASLRAAS